MKTTIAAALLAAALALPAHADPPFVAIDGACTRVVVLGTLMNEAECQSPLVQLVMPNGRIGFLFTLHKGPPPAPFMLVSFFGDSRLQVHPTADTAVQPVDAVWLGTDLHDNSRMPAVGSCHYANPAHPPASMRCSVETKGGLFVGEFTVTGIRY